MTAVFDDPFQDPDDWSEEQWLEWLADAPPDPETGRAHVVGRARATVSGTVLAAAMLGLDRAIYGERPKTDIVVVADSDGLDLGDIDLDPDNPAASRMTLPGGE